MIKICFIGAGSTIFAKNLIGDILLHKEIGEVHLVLHDIDEERLATSKVVAERIIDLVGKPTTRLTSTLDRKEAIKNANYVIMMMQIGGYKPGTVRDFAIPKKYGLRQTIADTLGIGGIMRAQRTIPVFLDMCRDIIEGAPDALVINYVNPMAMLLWAAKNVYPDLKILGLCHSVQLTVKELGEDLNIKPANIGHYCAGINHMAFYLKLFETSSATSSETLSETSSLSRSAEGVDLYPKLRDIAVRGAFPKTNKVRYDMFEKLGYFVTESSEHFSEYVPWYIKKDRPDLIEKFNIPLDEYITRCEQQLTDWKTLKKDFEDPSTDLIVEPSDEVAAKIIAALTGGTAITINANLPNQQPNKELLITNLPENCIVEVPCYIGGTKMGKNEINRSEVRDSKAGNNKFGDSKARNSEIGNRNLGNSEIGNRNLGNSEIENRNLGNNKFGDSKARNSEIENGNLGNNGIGNNETWSNRDREFGKIAGVVPRVIGDLPPHLAALMRTNINVQELAVIAALEKKKDYLYYAAMMDPHTSSELALDDIYRLVDEMVDSHADYLPCYH
ncbi:alpha-galactosidase [Spirochaetota bacterium]|nr:alpha-galactosidase [Spirochaetota bacterium]